MLSDHPTLDAATIAEAVPALVWTAMPEGKAEWFNQRWFEYTGRTIDAGRVLEQVIHPGDHAQVMAAWERAKATAMSFHTEYRIRRYDGVFRWHFARVIPLRNEGGVIVRWLGTAFDVHDRHELHSALAESEERSRALADANPSFIWTTTPQGRPDYYNETFYRYTGLTPDEALRVGGLAALIHPDDLPTAEARWMSALESGEPHVAETRLRRKQDGVYRWHLVTAHALRDDHGAIVRWIGVTTDIDDQKRAERNLRFLDDIHEALVHVRNGPDALQRIGELSIPEFADLIVFAHYDAAVDDLAIDRVVASNLATLALANELAARYSPGKTAPTALAVAKSGQSAMISIVDRTKMAPFVVDEDHLRLLERLDIRSIAVVPMRAGERDYGVMEWCNFASSRVYENTDLQLAEIVAGRLAVALDNIRVFERERRVADTFQLAALPKSLPRLDEARLHAVYAPAESEAEIGGDWYDAFRVGDERLILSIGDVAGKGLDAAVLMSSVRHAIRVAAYQGLDASAILRAADAALRGEFGDRFVTSWVGVVNLKTWTITYANAGHPPPYIREPTGKLTRLLDGEPPLGLLDAAPQLRAARLATGALLVLYTDGVIEATRDVLEGEQRLEAALRDEAMRHASDPARLLRDTVLPSGAGDDVALLTLWRERGRHWSFEAFDAKRAHGARASFVQALRERATTDSDFSAAETIFGELVGNVVRYAPGPIDIDLEWDASAPVLHVLDRGPGFRLDLSLPRDPLAENGRGLYIVAALGRGLAVTPIPGRGSRVSVELPVYRKAAT